MTNQLIREFIKVGDEVCCEYANPEQAEDSFEGVVSEVTDDGFRLEDGNGLYFADLSDDFDPADEVATFVTKDGAIDVYHVR